MYAVLQSDRLWRSADGGDAWAARRTLSSRKERVLPATRRAYALSGHHGQRCPRHLPGRRRPVVVQQHGWQLVAPDGGALPAGVAGAKRLLLATDGEDQARLYLSTGSGVWRSQDQGLSWQPAGPSTVGRGCQPGPRRRSARGWSLPVAGRWSSIAQTALCAGARSPCLGPWA